MISWGTENNPSGDVVYKSYWRADGEGGSRPFFHPVDAGLPAISLLVYAEIGIVCWFLALYRRRVRDLTEAVAASRGPRDLAA